MPEQPSICANCGTEYRRPPSQVGKYCSRSCTYAARRKETPAKYRMLYAPGHPLAHKSPYIPEHRAILWDRIGPGEHPCHHCSKPVTWLPGTRTKRGTLVVDHLDRNEANNSPENLVPSCQPCNIRNREYTVTDDEVYRVRPNGTRLRGEKRSCERCGNEFVATPDPRPGTGRFCSRSCARRRPATAA